jgi:thioredoxin-related protein
MEKKLEMFANVAIIVVALMIVGVFGYNFLSQPPSPKKIQIGTKINIPETVLEKNQTFLVVLQKDCRFCSESASFYQKLSEATKNKQNTDLIAALPSEIDVSKQYLQSLNVKIEKVIKVSLENLQVQGTPTLILLDLEGKVIESWIGKLPTEIENEVLKKIL